MEIIILPTSDDVGRAAADLIAQTVQRNPRAVLGLATGSSPVGIYRALARRLAASELDFSEVSGFALDEYVGLPLDHPESYASVIARDVVVPLAMDPARVRVPDGLAPDLDAAAREYDRAIAAAGGIDVQILGIGANGHIGFNEPTSSLSSRTRVKTLSAETREANARFFSRPADVPTHCVTQGVGTIREARKVVLVAQGGSKAAAVAAAVEGPVSASVPASVLQFHEDAVVILDDAAASRLTGADYYRYVAAHKELV